MSHRLLFIGRPQAKQRPRFSRYGAVYTPKETRDYEKLIRAEAALTWQKHPLQGPVALRLTFFVEPMKKVKREYPTARPDLDNYVKAITDALNEVVWVDDSQIVDIHASKRFGTPRVEVEITELGEGNPPTVSDGGLDGLPR
jgi:Holliday junction resolvase RusA-like endonuclease